MKWMLFAMLFFPICLNAQQQRGDTTIEWLGAELKPAAKGKHSYTQRTWPEAGIWHRQIHDAANTKLVDYWFADKAATIKAGTWQEYHAGGSLSESCTYKNGKKEGFETAWHDDGTKIRLQHWRNGLPVDTAYWWDEESKLAALQVTDAHGNGWYKSFQKGSNALRGEGQVLAGERSGKWIFRDKNGIVSMDAYLNADTVTAVTCYDEQGKLEANNKNCIFETGASFAGGAEGWLKFLEGNLRYPKAARAEEAQGVVRVQFIVDEIGNISETSILKAPHAALAQETLRIMKKSPKWVPAMQYNRPVTYRHIQSITFQLE